MIGLVLSEAQEYNIIAELIGETTFDTNGEIYNICDGTQKQWYFTSNYLKINGSKTARISLNGVLNDENYYINQYSDSTGARDLMLNIQSLVKLPIPQQQSQKLIDAIKRENDDLIDQSIFEIYGFSKDEIDFICNYVS